jgi:UDP-N-acetylmuramoylalanine--D-glutamate ligase
MRIAILGYGSQGRSSYEYWNSAENQITICDRAPVTDAPKDVVLRIGEDYLKNLDEFELIVRSPSVHPRDIVAANSPSILEKVTTNTNEFFRVCPTKNIIGVTGTKGKGTTSTLIAKLLEVSGKTVRLGGNIGTPPLDLLKYDIEEYEWVVLELANFQLIDLKYSPHIAVCLMVVPEHLDWHTDFDEYVEAKSQLFRWQTANDIAIYYAGNETSKHIASHGKGKKIPYFAPPGAFVKDGVISIGGTDICQTKDLQLIGEHNWQNVCAALTVVTNVTWDEAIKLHTRIFKGLEHRLEFVREVQDVKYYNDSFGTTPETAIVAIKAFQEPKVIILGGSDKGASYDELAKTVMENNVRAAVVIGDTRPVIQEALERAGFPHIITGGATMEEIVSQAREQAQPGDVVLLSTGCASFGLFKDYKDRGEQFKQVVQALA